MLIVLEGADGAGKTTISNELERLATQGGDRVTTLHAVQPQGDPLPMYLNGLVGYEPNPRDERLWICDRWHVGELIYGPLYRDESKITMAQARQIDGMLAHKGAVRVFVDANDNLIYQRAFEERGEDFVKASDLLGIAARYREVIATLDTGWVTIRNDGHLSVSAIAKYLLRVADFNESRIAA